MNPIDLLRKPLSVSPKLFQPANPAPVAPTLNVSTGNPPENRPPSMVSLVMAPISKNPLPSPITTPEGSAPAPSIKTANTGNILQDMMKPLAPRTVRPQDFYDVLNILPQVVGSFVGPAIAGVQSLRTALTGKESKDIHIPTVGPEGRGSILDVQSSQNFYNQQLDAGVDPHKAFWQTALKTVGDMSVLVPLARDAGKLALLKTAPEKLINSDIVSASRQQIRDFASGADAYSTGQSPLPQEIQDAFKAAPTEEKSRLIKSSGIDIMTAKPSNLGRLFGISQEEADALLKSIHGGPIREGSAGALPGFRDEPGQPAPVGASTRRVERVGGAETPAPFQGYTDLSTNILNKLEGRSTVSKQFIQDLTNGAEVKQAEREMIRKALESEPETVNVKDFAEKVKSELLPLENASERTGADNAMYENVTLPDELRGPIKDYKENVYTSPVKTSAGNVHGFNEVDNYFAHTRTEELPDNTRRIIEVQSDLFQKGRLEGEGGKLSDQMRQALAGERTTEIDGVKRTMSDDTFAHNKDQGEKTLARAEELKKLEPYRNTWHERVIREEVKKAAQDGKTTLQFPTGETAMKIEGLGDPAVWKVSSDLKDLTTENGKVGMEVQRSLDGDTRTDGQVWIITDVLGDGKFKAVPKHQVNAVTNAEDALKMERKESGPNIQKYEQILKQEKDVLASYRETFDISGKVDTNNPIYKFYEKEVGRYLKNKYDAQLVTDKQGVKWWEVKVKPEHGQEPVTAYSKGGNFTPDLDTAVAEKALRELFSTEELDLVFDPELRNREGNLGFFSTGQSGPFSKRFKPMISLLESNGKVDSRVLYHEAFHAHFNMYLTAQERAEAIAKVRKNPLTQSYKLKAGYSGEYAKAEEWLADDFADYVKTKKSKAGLEGLWEKLLQKIRDLIRRTEKFKNIYDDILAKNKKAGEPTVSAHAAQAEPYDAKKLNQLYKQLDKEEKSLASYNRNPEAHISAYGEDRKPQYEAKIAELKAKIAGMRPEILNRETSPEIRSDYRDTEMANKEIDKELRKESKKNLADLEKGKQDEHISQLEQTRDDLRTVLKEHPAKPLLKYVSPETGRLPEVTGKNTMKSLTGSRETVSNSKFGERGDQLIAEPGFKDLEDAQVAVEDYQNTKKRLNQVTVDLIDARKEISDARAADADKRSAEVLLNKTARQTEEDIAKRDAEKNRQLSIEKSTKEGMERVMGEVTRNLSYKEKIDRAHMLAGKKKGFLARARATLFPLTKGVDAETKDILLDWLTKKLIAKDVANQTAVDMSKLGPQNLEEINAYEAGKNTAYIREAMDTLGTQAKREGLDFPFRENYLPHIYAQDRDAVVAAISKYLKITKKMTDAEVDSYLNGNELPKEKSLRLKLRPFFVKERIFPSYSAAAKYGLSPKYRSPAKLVAHYQEELETTLANKKLLEKLQVEGKLLNEQDAPDSWVPVTRKFSKVVQYAEPELARLLNDRFRDEADLDLMPRIVKGIAEVSRFMQEVKLSAGIPFTNVNYFSTGQAIRLLTTAVGETAKGDLSGALSSLKSSFAYVRANSNTASAKWFYNNRAVLARMALEGIDISGRVGNFKFEKFGEAMSEALENVDKAEGFMGTNKAVVKVLGLGFDKAFNEKTFGSMMSQVSVQTFKDSYDMAIQQGASDAEAGKFAAQVTRNISGISKETLRGKTTEDTLTSLFFAPKFREGVMNVLGNTAAAFTPENLRDASFAKNRGFVLGAVITFALYQVLNKKLNGKYTWQNPSGREFAIRLPLPNKQVGYIEFLPSFLSFPRNLAEGGIATAKGDFSTAIQKFGSVFSMPLKITSEVLGNSDYFGREIYKDTDSGKEKIQKIAAYVGLGTAHPFITETAKYLSGGEPLYQALSYMLEAPLKYSTQDKEDKSAYYDMLDKQTAKRNDMKDRVRPIYESNQKLIADGKRAEATRAYNALSKNDRTIYDNIKKSEKAKATIARKPFVSTIYEENQRLIKEGKTREAAKIYRELSAQDRKIYDTLKKSKDLLSGE